MFQERSQVKACSPLWGDRQQLAEYEAESDNTEELDEQNSITTFKTNVGLPKNEKKPFQALKFTIMVNGKPAQALADTGTIGGTLLSNHFVTTITYTTNYKRTL